MFKRDVLEPGWLYLCSFAFLWAALGLVNVQKYTQTHEGVYLFVVFGCLAADVYLVVRMCRKFAAHAGRIDRNDQTTSRSM